jgi:hypothetical protein
MTAVRPAPTLTPRDARAEETRAAMWALLGAVLLGALAGVAWGLLAPAEHLIVLAPGRGLPLTDESDHEFDALAIFVCLSGVAGVVSALAAWQWRRMRGPILAASTLIGTAVGGAAAKLIGEQLARWRYPHHHNPPLHTVVALAPAVGSDAALFAAPFLAAVMLTVLVILSPRDDLGTGRGPDPVDAEPEPAA